MLWSFPCRVLQTWRRDVMSTPHYHSFLTVIQIMTHIISLKDVGYSSLCHAA